MRTVYLIRHGEPDFPGGQRLCISRTDLPLSTVGRMQGILLAAALGNTGLSGVYHSGALRASQTAACLSPNTQRVEGFEELGVGAWEGLTFQEIRKRYPKEYEMRGKDPFNYLIPGGERPADCLDRAKRALRGLLERTEGNIAVVTHAGVCRLLLSDLLKQPSEDFLDVSQPYGCVNVLQYEDGEWTILSVGTRPHPSLEDTLCEKLHKAAGTPEAVYRHCLAVADKADALAALMERRGIALDRKTLRAAALLHDIARTAPDHAAAGAGWLARMGYPALSEIVARHHDWRGEDPENMPEAALVYVADKLVQGDRAVTLEERFGKSMKVCLTPEAKAAHQRRWEWAKKLYDYMTAGTGN